MKLKLLLPSTGQSWTIKPNQEYIIGKDTNCQIPVNGMNIADRHAKLSFNQITNTWYIIDLSTQGILVNNKQVKESIINPNTIIILGGEITLNITPQDTINNIPTPLPNIPNTPTPPPIYTPQNQGFNNQINPPQSNNFQPQNYPISQQQSRHPSPSLRVLTWADYVKEQVKNQNGWLNKIATKFYLITGFRNTPWLRNYGKTGFDAFDGYIIPDFTGSAEEVAREVEQQLGQLRNYENTDCYVAKLTDGHIADSATQSFLGVELFPIKRGKKPDYRRFCVVAYHRVRTYLLVENYGNDLYVNWITRFEPKPNPIIAKLMFFLCCLNTFIMFIPAINNSYDFWAIMIGGFIPLFMWLTYYVTTPVLMEVTKVVPKKANGRLFLFISFFLFFLFPLTIIMVIVPIWSLFGNIFLQMIT